MIPIVARPGFFYWYTRKSGQKMKKHFGIVEAGQLFGVSPSTISDWVNRGLLSIAEGGGTKGKRRKLDLMGLLAVGVLSSLGKRGVPQNRLKQIGKFFSDLSRDSLESELVDGTIFLVSGDELEPRLVSPMALVANSSQATVLVVIDIQTSYQRLRKQLTEELKTQSVLN